jgi:hypothetical protein
MPHIDMMKTALGAACADFALSLIIMSTDSLILLDRVPVDDTLCSRFEELGRTSGRSHGHYVPALKQLRTLLRPDIARRVHPVVFFISDGAPSDHNDRECKHGVKVWQPCPVAQQQGLRHRSGRLVLQTCTTPASCRQYAKKQTVVECCDIVEELGGMFGEDRITVNTVAFGEPSLDYDVLQQMARVVQRGNFQKLGLGIHRLRSALSTLSSSITTILTTGGGGGLTLRESRPMETKESFHAPVTRVTHREWDVYTMGDRTYGIDSKQAYDWRKQKFVDVPLSDSAAAARSR